MKSEHAGKYDNNAANGIADSYYKEVSRTNEVSGNDTVNNN